MAENRVIVEGNYDGPLPVILTGTTPPGTTILVAQGPPPAGSAPSSAMILAGSLTAAGTLITIPANKIWYGFFGLSATLVGSAKTATVTIQTVDGGATPGPSVDIRSINLVTTALVDSTHGDLVGHYVYIYGGTSGTDVTATVTGDPGSLSATAYGYLLV